MSSHKAVELCAVDPIAANKISPPVERVGQATAIGGAQLRASDVQNQRGVGGVQGSGFHLFDDHKTDRVIGFITLRLTRATKRRAAHHPCKTPCKTTWGSPLGGVAISHKRQVMGMRMPKPTALLKASLAENGWQITDSAFWPTRRTRAPGLHFASRQHLRRQSGRRGARKRLRGCGGRRRYRCQCR